jgi:hypothetical protein
VYIFEYLEYSTEEEYSTEDVHACRCNMTKAGGPDGCRAFLFKLEVTLHDGTTLEHTSTAGSSSSWSGRQSPIVWDHLFHGETYDARREVDDWASPTAVLKSSDGWSPMHLMHHIPGPTQEGAINTTGPLYPAMLPPIRVTESFKAMAVRRATLPPPGGAPPPPPINCAGATGRPEGKLAFVATECEYAQSDPNCGPPRNIPPCCGEATAGTLKCQPGSGTIQNVTFAVWGEVLGDCGSGFHVGSCHADLASTLARVKAACLGRTECSFNASNTFDTNRTDPCPGKLKSLAVEASGCKAMLPPHAPPAPAPAPGAPARWVFDFGQNVNGFVTLSLPAAHGIPAGTQLRLEHGEITHELSQGGDTYDTYCHVNPGARDLRHEPCHHQTYGGAGVPRADWGHDIAYEYIGDFNCANMTNIYIVKDPSTAIEYTPFFATAGFRFVSISGLPPSFGHPPLSMLTSHFIHSDVTPYGNLQLAPVAAEGNGTYATADVLNGIHHLVRYSQMANLFSVPTDCPQRERRGWMGDAQVTSHEAMLSFDMQTFYEKWFDDIRDDQLWGCGSRHSDGGSTCGGQNTSEAHGSVADVTPYDGIGGWPGCPVWQVAYIVIARNHWHHYGDVTPLKKHYPGLVDLMHYFLRRADTKTGLLLDGGYGDWVCVGSGGGCPRTPSDSVSAFYFVQALGFLSEIATVIGREDEAQNWAKMHTAAVRAWHIRYFNAALGTYSPCAAEPLGSQTSNSMALALGAPPDAATRAKVVSRLVENIAANDGRFTFGIVGSAWLFPMLEESGHGDIALDILLTDTYPSFGHFLVENMTTLCENWKCSFHSPGGGSQNHIMYGAFDAWLVTAVGGMSTVSNTSSTAWQHIIVHAEPAAVTKVGRGSYALTTRFGPTAVRWAFDRASAKLLTNVTIPVGSTADVVHDAELRRGECTLVAVLESGLALWEAHGGDGDGAIATATTTIRTQQQSVAGVGAVAVHEVGDGGVRRRTTTTVGSGTYFFEARYECAM